MPDASFPPLVTDRLTPWTPPAKPLRHRVRDLVASALWHGGSERLRPAPGSLTVVTLHRFLPAEHRARYPWPQLAVTPDAFRRMLSHFGTWFRVLPLSAAIEAWEAGEHQRPLLAITVDDAQWDNFRWARPLLRRAGLRATFYVPTDAVDEGRLLWPDRLGFGLALAKANHLDTQPLLKRIGRSSMPPPDVLVEEIKQLRASRHAEVMAIVDRWLEGAGLPDWGRLMTWDELRELASEGHEIGGHSRTHPILPQCDDRQLHDEVHGCMQRLQEELGAAGHAIRSFAYPNGDTDDRVCDVVRAAGFDNAVTCEEGRADPAGDRLRLARIDLQEELTQGLLGRVDSPSLAFRLRDR